MGALLNHFNVTIEKIVVINLLKRLIIFNVLSSWLIFILLHGNYFLRGWVNFGRTLSRYLDSSTAIGIRVLFCGENKCIFSLWSVTALAQLFLQTCYNVRILCVRLLICLASIKGEEVRLVVHLWVSCSFQSICESRVETACEHEPVQGFCVTVEQLWKTCKAKLKCSKKSRQTNFMSKRDF